MVVRQVVILCGPPGAGKSTLARRSGLAVFDRDDPDWRSERQFTSALASLRDDPAARAVVIRSAASSSARRRSRDLVRATHAFLVLPPRDEVERRVRARGRDVPRDLAGIRSWFEQYDTHDSVQRFPGWGAVAGEGIGSTSRRW